MFAFPPPSLQKRFAEFSARDPAFRQLGAKPADAELEKYKQLLERVRDTGDWTELRIDGREPTKFVMRSLLDNGDQYRKLLGLGAGALELFQLAFRCALVDIENAGDLRFKPQAHEMLGELAHVDITNALDSISPDIVNELGALALKRAREVIPKP